MTATAPLISVIIPAYNYAHMLPRALESVLSQLADDIEIIVVNDGSTDNTEQILLDFFTKNPAIKVYHQENSGAAAARNHGIRMSAGKYVLLLDADDALTDNALSLLREAIVLYPDAGLVLGGKISIYPNGRERVSKPTPVQSAAPCELARQYLLQKTISISHGSSLFRRDILVQRLYPERLRGMEDIPVFLHMLINADVCTIEQPLVRVHKHAGSLRHTRKDSEQRALILIDEVFKTLPKECANLRKSYKAQRYLSLFRAALNAGELDEARLFYRTALSLDFLHALKWSYMRKALRLLWVSK